MPIALRLSRRCLRCLGRISDGSCNPDMRTDGCPPDGALGHPGSGTKGVLVTKHGPVEVDPYWEARLPIGVAAAQTTWDNDLRLLRAFKHVTGKELAQLVGVSPSALSEKIKRGQRRKGQKSPVEIYLLSLTDVLDLAELVKLLGGIQKTLGDWNEMCGLPRDYRPGPIEPM